MSFTVKYNLPVRPTLFLQVKQRFLFFPFIGLSAPSVSSLPLAPLSTEVDGESAVLIAAAGMVGRPVSTLMVVSGTLATTAAVAAATAELIWMLVTWGVLTGVGAIVADVAEADV